MGSHNGIVFLCKLGAEVVDVRFVMVILHHVEIHADILFGGMDGNGAVVLWLGHQRPFAIIVFQHGDLSKAFRHFVQRKLRCPSLLAFLGRFFYEFDLLAVLGLLDHAHSAVDILQDTFAHIWIGLDLGYNV